MHAAFVFVQDSSICAPQRARGLPYLLPDVLPLTAGIRCRKTARFVGKELPELSAGGYRSFRCHLFRPVKGDREPSPCLLLTFSGLSIYNRTCSARLCAGNALTTENPCVRKILTERVSPEEGHRESAVVRAGTGDGTEDHSRIAVRTAAGGRLSSAPFKAARCRRISPLQEARMDPDRTVLS